MAITASAEGSQSSRLAVAVGADAVVVVPPPATVDGGTSLGSRRRRREDDDDDDDDDDDNGDNDDGDNDAFLLSMTFASGKSGCVCLDCGDDPLPRSLRDAVNAHNERRGLAAADGPGGSRTTTTTTTTKRQYRKLVKREMGFDLWRLGLPVDVDDPIVEYRNNHRMMFVERLDEASSVLSVGEGIIGSAAEERSRRRLDWREGSSYLLARSDGMACGWIHKRGGGGGGDNVRGERRNDYGEADEGGGSATPNDDDDGGPTTTDVDDVVLYSLKVSAETLRGMEDAVPEGASTWVRRSRELFLGRLAGERTDDALRRRRPRNSDDRVEEDGGGDDSRDDRTIAPPEGIVLTDDETLTMRLVIDLAR
ncbi:hypothetical protein ACHAW5_000767 [Stephanodiscus triporus]|uniref:Uncharacterized protein n=1 Tax=Stephanodiscus triporus TaxID=2934178 RepID=A0ABD3MWW5_9STRA